MDAAQRLELEFAGRRVDHPRRQHAVLAGARCGATASFAYLDGNCINLSSGGAGQAFAADTDNFRLNERVLRLGMVWQWKANKGSPYAEDMATYNDALEYEQGHDKPSPILVGRRADAGRGAGGLSLAGAVMTAATAYANFRRMPVPQQVAQQLQVTTLPAPTRGLILNENESFMQPGGALVLDNWMPTMKGIALRGGCTRWCDLHALDVPVPPVPDPSRLPVVSMFQYISGNVQRIFAGQQTKLFDVTAGTPLLIKSGQNSGNYVASQLANLSGDHMLVCNDAGDYVLHFDGSTWTTFNAGQLTGPGRQ